MIIHKPSAPEVVTRTDVQLELAAMQAVADTLAGISDAAARARVVRWAQELFAAADLNIAAASATEPVARVLTLVGRGTAGVDPSLRVDPSLDVVGIERLFEPESDAPAVAVAELPASPVDAADESAVSMVHGFVEDFRKLAQEWERR